MPVSGAPSRVPLEGFSVPMFFSVLAPLSVNAVPEWQDTQFAANTALPAVAPAVKLPSELRYGVGKKSVSDARYAASASRSVLTPFLGSPSACERVPVANWAAVISPLPWFSVRI